MPNYIYECSKGHRFEAFAKMDERMKIRCPTHKIKPMHIVPAMQEPIFFREGFYEHLDTKPIYITSKRQLKDEARKRGLTSIYAEEW